MKLVLRLTEPSDYTDHWIEALKKFLVDKDQYYTDVVNILTSISRKYGPIDWHDTIDNFIHRYSEYMEGADRNKIIALSALDKTLLYVMAYHDNMQEVTLSRVMEILDPSRTSEWVRRCLMVMQAFANCSMEYYSHCLVDNIDKNRLNFLFRHLITRDAYIQPWFTDGDETSAYSIEEFSDDLQDETDYLIIIMRYFLEELHSFMISDDYDMNKCSLWKSNLHILVHCDNDIHKVVSSLWGTSVNGAKITSN